MVTTLTKYKCEDKSLDSSVEFSLHFEGYKPWRLIVSSGCYWKCSLAVCRTDVSGSYNATSPNVGGHSGSVHWYLTN